MSTAHTSLTAFNSFGLSVHANRVITVETPDALFSSWQQSYRQQEPVLILGGGSNVLFLDDFSGTVILNRIQGIVASEHADAWHLHVGAGENWHRLVEYTLQEGMFGLENLALIPGCAGSAPIQNIGAYGVEFQHVCEYVDVLNLRNGDTQRLTAQECCFGYRDSIFKHAYHDGYAITAIGLQLPKQWQPVLSYGDLTQLDPQTVTPRQVFDSVCHMRRTKLPDPAVTGNAGSFFKNPIVSAEHADGIRKNYPDMPAYPQRDGLVKLAAGWLIDRCDLKGFHIGGAAVHERQALVLINKDNATSQDILLLAKHVREQVMVRFSVDLEPEVRFIAAEGEVDAVEALS